MSSSEDISKIFIATGIMPGTLVGQNAVSKTYLDAQLAAQDARNDAQDVTIASKTLVDGMVTNPKLAPLSVTADKVANEAIELRHLTPELKATETLVGVNARFIEVDAQLAEKAKQIDIDYLTKQLVPKRYIHGGQLAKLKQSLSNPLEQYVGIVFVTDSIGWGLTSTGNPPDFQTGRDGTLSDIRDNYASLSFVNNFKRYIGSKYAFNATPTLSNWSASTAGQAITLFERVHLLYPWGGDFTITTAGSGGGVATHLASSPSKLGWQVQLSADSTGTKEHTLSFNFTGDEFTLFYDATTAALNYELFVNDVSQGEFSATPGVNGVVSGYSNQRTHSFGYVRNKTIKLVTRQAGYVGIGVFRPTAISINKKIRITNQGIIGTTAKVYKERNMTGNTSGDGIAVGSYDNYVFCQVGTNDRLTSIVNYPKGSNTFKYYLQLLVNNLTSLADVILMVSNPVANESTSTYSFTMQDVRNVIYLVAKENSLDFIDNYSIFGDVPTTVYTADGLHPNDFGHGVYSRNIINSLEFN